MTAKTQKPAVTIDEHGHTIARVDDLRHDEHNARARSDNAVDLIAESLKRFGQQKPIVVDRRGVVIAGNGTLDAARTPGWSTMWVEVTDLKGAEARAFALVDNRSAELAFWDDQKLLDALASIDATEDSDLLYATGFTQYELAGLKATLEGISQHPEEQEGTERNVGMSSNLADDVEEPQHSCPECGFKF